MYFTDFFPFFMLAAWYALRGPTQWAVTTGIMAFFQAASPILIGAGGRAIGLAPAYCLVPIAFILLIKDRARITPEARRAGIPIDVWLLIYFSALIIGGAFLLPRVFQGYVNVLPTRGGLDSGVVIPLKPSSTNVIQAVYMVFNVLLILLPWIFAKRKYPIDAAILKGLTIGAVISGLLGFYQIIGFQLGLPWPSSIINSNLGVMQLEEQTLIGMRRMSSTFLEPSMLSLHFLAAFGLLMLGQRKVAAGLFCLAVLVFSTSTTAYIGLALLLMVWFATNLRSMDMQMLKVIFPIAMGVALAVAADYFFANGEYVQRLLIKKFEGGSGAARLNADALAWASLRDSFGLGVGIGSLRASSLLATLTASAGLPTTLVFFAFLGCVLYRTVRVSTAIGQGLFYCMIGVLVAWAIAIPDWTLPIFWLACGAAIAHRFLLSTSGEAVTA
ncbi:MAG: hypothetical protein ACM3VZ_12330 [Acidobacteriota bacterium]